MHLLYISIIQLSNYKIFLGHSIFNTILLSSWLIFNIRGKNTILNLYHTIKMLKLSYTLLKYVINMGFPFWFVNFDLTKEDIIKNNAFKSGEFYVTRRWIRGLISNFFVITKAYRQYLIKKDFIDSNKVKDLFEKWVFTRFTWPRAIFISNVKSAFIVSKEALSARVPSIALVDTDVKTFLYNIPIGCNDDTIESIGFMNSIMSQYILRFKYKKVLIWYYFNRNIQRFNVLLEWLKNLIKLKKKIKYNIKLKDLQIPNYLNYFTGIKKGLNFFFGRSFNFKLISKNNNLKREKIVYDSFYDVNKIFFFNRLKVLNYKMLSYKYRLKFKRYKYLSRIEGVSSFKSFLNNFVRFNTFFSRSKRIKIKKRIRMARKSVSKNFKFFFHFIFFFFLNKFNIIIDSYNNENYNILNIIRIFKNFKKKKSKYKKKYKNINERKFKYDYIFRFKSKKIYKKKKKRKYGYIYDDYDYNNINKERSSMSFLFFHWRYFLIFLGLKLRNKSFSFKNRYITKIKK